MSRIRLFVLLTLFLSIFPITTQSQVFVDEVVSRPDPKLNRSRGISMLKGVKETLEQFYYDKNYRGIDIDQKFKTAEEEIKKLDTNAKIFRVIASLLLEFNDSHTRFYPPGRSSRVEYGFSMQMIGDKCMVVDVKKGSNAETKGLKIGDVITKIGQYPVTRDTLWGLNYYLYQLEPMPVLPVFVQEPGNAEKGIAIEASFKTLEERRKEAEKLRKQKRESPYKCHKISQEVIACKLQTFSVERKFIDQMMKEAAGSTKIILDLRGNRGGSVKIEEYLVGHFFDREVKIADMVMRKRTDSRIAKPVRDRQFPGEITVLVDSDSASASEVFARVIQLEKRGKVVGDVSAGAVMTSYQISMANRRGPDGFESLSFYGMNVTIADVIMSDGNRLENIGVIPDHAVGPTREALMGRSDPVLAYSAGLMGAKITPADAGKLQFLWKKPESDDEDDDKDGDSGNQ
ncbi:MAG: S41 family peptidase [Pyrinomonadaceae bacterium]